MALNDVAIHHRGVATGKFTGDTETAPVNVLVFDINRLHTETVVSQMINPRAATPSICLFIDLNDGFTAGLTGDEQKSRNAEQNNF